MMDYQYHCSYCTINIPLFLECKKDEDCYKHKECGYVCRNGKCVVGYMVDNPPKSGKSILFQVYLF